MDTSEQYIKMCDCEEVQGEEPGEVGDYAYTGEDARSWGGWKRRYWVVIRTDDGDAVVCIAEYESGEERTIFLPRQDQIQEWVWNKDGPVSPLRLFGRFCAFHFTLGPPELSDFHTPEQLWLAFYMYETFGKVWNGEEWVKSDGEEVWVR